MAIMTPQHPTVDVRPVRPTRVEVLSPHDLVRSGIGALLAGTPNLDVVPPTSAASSALDGAHRSTDALRVVVIDSLWVHLLTTADSQRAIADSSVHVLTLARRGQPELTDRALDLGARGCVPLHCTRTTLLDAVVGARREHVGTLRPLERHPHLLNPFPAPTDLQTESLTLRELEMLALIALGHDNTEIAGHLFVSVNTVKSHVRSAYTKIHVHTRSQAVLWGVEKRVSDLVRRESLRVGSRWVLPGAERSG